MNASEIFSRKIKQIEPGVKSLQNSDAADVPSEATSSARSIFARKIQPSGGFSMNWRDWLDRLQRGQYASANVVKEMRYKPPEEQHPFRAAWQGLTGRDKGSFRDIAEREKLPGPFWWGLGGDIFLDPTTYLTFGGLTKAGTKASKLGKLGATATERAAKGQIAAVKYMGVPLVKGTKIYEAGGKIGRKAITTPGLSTVIKAFNPTTGIPELDALVKKHKLRETYGKTQSIQLGQTWANKLNAIAKATGRDVKDVNDEIVKLIEQKRYPSLIKKYATHPDIGQLASDIHDTFKSTIRAEQKAGVPIAKLGTGRAAEVAALKAKLSKQTMTGQKRLTRKLTESMKVPQAEIALLRKKLPTELSGMSGRQLVGKPGGVYRKNLHGLDYSTLQSIKRNVDKIVEDVKDDIQGVYIVGSRSKGTFRRLAKEGVEPWKKTSDVDILVVPRKGRANYVRRVIDANPTFDVKTGGKVISVDLYSKHPSLGSTPLELEKLIKHPTGAPLGQRQTARMIFHREKAISGIGKQLKRIPGMTAEELKVGKATRARIAALQAQRELGYFPRFLNDEVRDYLKSAAVGGRRVWNPRIANALKRKTGEWTIDEVNNFFKAYGLEKLGGRKFEEFFLKDPAYVGTTRMLRSVKAVTGAQFLRDAAEMFGVKSKAPAGEYQHILRKGEGKVVNMPLSKINTEFEGNAPSAKDVMAMMDILQKGGTLPPIVVSPNRYLQDGRHRLEAYKNLGYKEIPVIIGYDPNVAGVTRAGKQLELEIKEYMGQKYKTPKLSQPQGEGIGEYQHILRKGTDIDTKTPLGWMESSAPQLKGYKFAPEVLKEIDRAYNIITQPDTMNKFLKTVFDPTQRWWKAHVLSYFPAYHSRNFASNIWNNYLGGVHNPVNYTDAVKIQVYDYMLSKGLKPVAPVIPGLDVKAALLSGKKMGIQGRGLIGLEVPRSVESEIMKGNWNILSQNFHLVKGGRRVGGFIEDNARWAHYIDKLKKGMGVDAAADSVKKYLFDYEDLTEFERKTMKRVFPFYTWSRKNIPLQIETALTKPGKMAVIPKAKAGIEYNNPPPQAEKQILPPWIEERLPVRLGKTKEGYQEYFPLESYLPAADVMKLGRPFRAAGEMLDPFFLRMPMETLFGRSLYYNQPLEKYPGERVPFLGMDLPAKAVYPLRSIRALSEINRLLPPPKGPAAALQAPELTGKEKAIRALTGVKLERIDPARQMQFYMQAQKKRLSELKAAYYKAKMSGRENEARRIQQLLIRTIRENIAEPLQTGR